PTCFRPPRQKPQDNEPVVFLWSVRRKRNLEAKDSLKSAPFEAFSKVWRLQWDQYRYEEKGQKKDSNAFGIFLVPDRADEASPQRHSDLVRSVSCTPIDAAGRGWNYTHADERQLGLNDSLVIGVAIYPPGTSISEELYLPPTTVTPTFLHQAEDSATANLFVRQMPMLHDGIFPRLLGNPTDSDVTFIVEEQEIPAHAAILRSDRAGPYFAALLAHEFKEKKDGKVHISGVTYKLFKAILEFVYAGRTAADSIPELMDLYCVADRFQVAALLPFIKGELFLSLARVAPPPETLLTLIQQMKPFPDLSTVVQVCVKHAVQNWAKIKACAMWSAVVTGPDAQDIVEVLLDEACGM
ncbi:hypothetical protein HK104_005978, partial [Borealophlyctis nickersoniae]